MTKPQTIGGYGTAVTEACERVLVTLLRGLGPWKDSVFLVGDWRPDTWSPPARPRCRPTPGPAMSTLSSMSASSRTPTPTARSKRI
ncbi:hypothetical protein ACFSUK_18755 [Sphingobium scionense]